MWINGGYFVLRSELLDDLHPGEELVDEPFQRLIAKNQLLAHRHDGFWAPMDTLKEKQWLESLHESGQAPWELWSADRRTEPRILASALADAPAARGPPGRGPLKLLALGAHSDDAEIGCGGTVLQLIDARGLAEVCWVVLSGRGRAHRGGARERGGDTRGRAGHARSSSPASATASSPTTAPTSRGSSRSSRRFEPDLILTHQRNDPHQDHRLTCELTWNTFRNHLILEYEVPKYDGDMGRPNFFVPLDEDVSRRKVEHLMKHFGVAGSQALVHRGPVRGPAAAARDGVQLADLARRGVLLPQGRPGVTGLRRS